MREAVHRAAATGGKERQLSVVRLGDCHRRSSCSGAVSSGNGSSRSAASRRGSAGGRRSRRLLSLRAELQSPQPPRWTTTPLPCLPTTDSDSSRPAASVACCRQRPLERTASTTKLVTPATAVDGATFLAAAAIVWATRLGTSTSGSLSQFCTRPPVHGQCSATKCGTTAGHGCLGQWPDFFRHTHHDHRRPMVFWRPARCASQQCAVSMPWWR